MMVNGEDFVIRVNVCDVNIIKILVVVVVGFVLCWFFVLVMDIIDVVIGVFILFC